MKYYLLGFLALGSFSIFARTGVNEEARIAVAICRAGIASNNNPEIAVKMCQQIQSEATALCIAGVAQNNSAEVSIRSCIKMRSKAEAICVAGIAANNVLQAALDACSDLK